MTKDELEGKVALVTGASFGIGQATTLALASVGAHVALAAQRIDRLDTLVQQITKSGGQALSIVTDIADEKQVQEMVDQTKAHGALGSCRHSRQQRWCSGSWANRWRGSGGLAAHDGHQAHDVDVHHVPCYR